WSGGSGAGPTGPVPGFGSLRLGDRRTETPALRHVVGFVEKPAPSRAQQLIAAGGLWNTLVACGTVDALWQLGRQTEPQLIDILDSFVPLVGTRDETDAIEYIYRAILPVSLSRDVLERAPERMVAQQLDRVDWRAWARPARSESARAVRRSRAPVPSRAYAP